MYLYGRSLSSQPYRANRHDLANPIFPQLRELKIWNMNKNMYTFIDLKLSTVQGIKLMQGGGAGSIIAHRFPSCRMRWLKGCPVGNASTAWDYAGLLCHLYRDAGANRCHYSQPSRAQFPFQPFYTWYNMLLTGLHQSPVISIPLHLPSNSSIFPFHFPSLILSITCTRVRGNHHHHSN